MLLITFMGLTELIISTSNVTVQNYYVINVFCWRLFDRLRSANIVQLDEWLRQVLSSHPMHRRMSQAHIIKVLDKASGMQGEMSSCPPCIAPT